jgi:hypothetical protein
MGALAKGFAFDFYPGITYSPLRDELSLTFNGQGGEIKSEAKLRFIGIGLDGSPTVPLTIGAANLSLVYPLPNYSATFKLPLGDAELLDSLYYQNAGVVFVEIDSGFALEAGTLIPSDPLKFDPVTKLGSRLMLIEGPPAPTFVQLDMQSGMLNLDFNPYIDVMSVSTILNPKLIFKNRFTQQEDFFLINSGQLTGEPMNCCLSYDLSNLISSMAAYVGPGWTTAIEIPGGFVFSESMVPNLPTHPFFPTNVLVQNAGFWIDRAVYNTDDKSLNLIFSGEYNFSPQLSGTLGLQLGQGGAVLNLLSTAYQTSFVDIRQMNVMIQDPILSDQIINYLSSGGGPLLLHISGGLIMGYMGEPISALAETDGFLVDITGQFVVNPPQQNTLIESATYYIAEQKLKLVFNDKINPGSGPNGDLGLVLGMGGSYVSFTTGSSTIQAVDGNYSLEFYLNNPMLAQQIEDYLRNAPHLYLIAPAGLYTSSLGPTPELAITNMFLANIIGSVGPSLNSPIIMRSYFDSELNKIILEWDRPLKNVSQSSVQSGLMLDLYYEERIRNSTNPGHRTLDVFSSVISGTTLNPNQSAISLSAADGQWLQSEFMNSFSFSMSVRTTSGIGEPLFMDLQNNVFNSSPPIPLFYGDGSSLMVLGAWYEPINQAIALVFNQPISVDDIDTSKTLVFSKGISNTQALNGFKVLQSEFLGLSSSSTPNTNPDQPIETTPTMPPSESFPYPDNQTGTGYQDPLYCERCSPLVYISADFDTVVSQVLSENWFELSVPRQTFFTKLGLHNSAFQQIRVNFGSKGQNWVVSAEYNPESRKLSAVFDRAVYIDTQDSLSIGLTIFSSIKNRDGDPNFLDSVLFLNPDSNSVSWPQPNQVEVIITEAEALKLASWPTASSHLIIHFDSYTVWSSELKSANPHEMRNFVEWISEPGPIITPPDTVISGNLPSGIAFNVQVSGDAAFGSFLTDPFKYAQVDNISWQLKEKTLGQVINSGVEKQNGILLFPLSPGEYTLETTIYSKTNLRLLQRAASFKLLNEVVLYIPKNQWLMQGFGPAAEQFNDWAFAKSFYSWDEGKTTDPIFGKYKSGQEMAFMEAGKSYWINSATEDTLVFDLPELNYNFERVLLNKSEDGWNQITNPFSHPIHLSALSGDYEPNEVWWWAEKLGRYILLNELDMQNQILAPYNGYWIRSTKDRGELSLDGSRVVFPKTGTTISEGAALAKKNRSEFFTKSDWRLGLTLQSPSGLDEFNFIGQRPGASLLIDPLDRFKPPPVDKQARLYFRQNQKQLSSDMRSGDDTRSLWNMVVEGENLAGANIEVEGLSSLNQAGLYLYVLTGKTWKPVPTNTPLKVSDLGGPGEYQLLVSEHPKESFIQQIQIFGNFPNPVQSYTEFRYAVPQHIQTNLILEIMDVDGKIIFNSKIGASGTYRWDAIDNQGNKLKSGLYHYRIRGDGVMASQKLLILP